MLFTKLGWFIAYASLAFGVLGIVMGIGVAVFSEDMQMNEALSRRYLGEASSGKNIDRGIYLILIGVAFGIAAEISQRLESLCNRL